MCLDPASGGAGEVRAEGSPLLLKAAGDIGCRDGDVPGMAGYRIASDCTSTIFRSSCYVVCGFLHFPYSF